MPPSNEITWAVTSAEQLTAGVEALSLFTGAKAMGFGTWIAEVQGIVTFVVESDEWRRYYDAGLSPLDAVAQHIKDEEV